MTETILFVDDEPNILAAFKRQLHHQFEMRTASNGREALQLLATSDPIPVIVSDLRMPVMDGIQFFTQVKDVSPDSVRILLTGHADLSAAIEAVNDGKIFQFLTKPCSPDVLVEAIRAGLDHYQSITIERKLFEETHQMSLRLLSEFLGLANPAAYNRAIRIRKIVNHMASRLKPQNAWQYQLAATLCQIGCIAIPASLLEKALRGERLTTREQRVIDSHPMIAFQILENISRIGSVAKMVRYQNLDYASFLDGTSDERSPEISLGAQILRTAMDYDLFMQRGMGHREILNFMTEKEHVYNPTIVTGLGDEPIPSDAWQMTLVDSEGVEVGMLLNQDLYTKQGDLFICKYQEVNASLLEQLQHTAYRQGIVEPFRVLVRTSPSTSGSEKQHPEVVVPEE